MLILFACPISSIDGRLTCFFFQVQMKPISFHDSFTVSTLPPTENYTYG